MAEGTEVATSRTRTGARASPGISWIGAASRVIPYEEANSRRRRSAPPDAALTARQKAISKRHLKAPGALRAPLC